MKQKILVIRFSSIGDIVLTSPVIRALKTQLPEAEVHFVTKEIFAPLLQHNPHLDRLHTFKKDIPEVLDELKKEKFDLIVDLHKNLRSLRLRKALGVRSLAFDKINLKKFMAVNFKMIDALPSKHIVDRYFETVSSLGVKNDLKGLEHFIDEKDRVDVANLFFEGKKQDFAALVVGGSYFTKKIPMQKLEEICRHVTIPLIALGDRNDALIAEKLKEKFPHVANACGKLSVNQSASVIRQSKFVISSDTGLMHIAAAYQKKIFSLWGNTIPEFGMSAYMPGEGSLIMEVKNLSCRPCSKLGYDKCPKGHFRCMMNIDVTRIDLA